MWCSMASLIGGHRLARAAQLLGAYLKAFAISARVLQHVEDRTLRSRYRKQLAHALRALWSNPHLLFVYAMKTAFHYHYAQLTRDLAPVEDGGEAVPTSVRSFSRAMRQDKAQAAAS